MTTMRKVHPSKRDAWLVAVLAPAIGVSLYTAFILFASGAGLSLLIAGVTLVAGAGLPLWILCATRYTLDADELLVQSGPFRWRIALADIERVVPTASALSSPALSLDRLRIDYGRGKSLLISPRDKAQFLDEIEVARRAVS